MKGENILEKSVRGERQMVGVSQLGLLKSHGRNTELERQLGVLPSIPSAGISAVQTPKLMCIHQGEHTVPPAWVPL